MVSEMKKFKWPRFKGEVHWIRCFAHILNLIAQSILQPFRTVKKNTTEDNDDPFDLCDTSEDEDEPDAEEQICR